MKKQKRLAAILGAAVVFAAVAGCSKPASETSAQVTSAQETSVQEISVQETSAEETTEPITTAGESGDTASFTMQTEAVDDGAPAITVPESLEMVLDSTDFDFMEGATASDEIDGAGNNAAGGSSSVSYGEIQEMFDAMPSEDWEFFWNVLEPDLRKELSEDEYNSLKAYVDVGKADYVQQPNSDYNDSNAKMAFELQNQRRMEVGLSALTWSDEAYELAKQRVLAIQSDFSHNGVPGGYGENICSGAETAERAVQLWYDSEGHRTNMLNSDYTYGAMANVGGYWVALFHD